MIRASWWSMVQVHWWSRQWLNSRPCALPHDRARVLVVLSWWDLQLPYPLIPAFVPTSFAMGVTGLWTVVQPCARPVKIEILNKKRLAIDASIWIYQFLKAVRDEEGNVLRNSHVVGFFRRICKLLFFDIKPIFVFNKGAPILKRQIVNKRKVRRESRREDPIRTVGKLLAVQMQRRAEESDRKRREKRDRPSTDQEKEVSKNLVYVNEL